MNVKLMGSRKNSRTALIIGVILLGLIVIIMPIYGMFQFNVLKEKHQEEIDELQAQLDSWQVMVNEAEESRKQVYVPIEDISMKTVITEEMVTTIDVFSSLSESEYMSAYDIGSITTVNLPKNIPIMKHLLVKEKINSDVRENEFSMFFLPSNLKKNEIVDVRITFPNGEDYIVLSKKKIYDTNLSENTVWVWLNEREIHRMGSAIIDAYLHSGTKLYVLKYVQPEIQDEVASTYVVNEYTMEVMRKSPNILNLATTELSMEARRQLDERLKTLPAENVQAVESKLGQEKSVREQVKVTEVEQATSNTESGTTEQSNTQNNEEADMEGSQKSNGFN